MKLSKFDIFGLVSLLSYTAMVIFSLLAYPGYDSLTMAVSELSSVGAPSADLAGRLSCMFGPCGLVSIMAVRTAAAHDTSKSFRFGVYFFTVMEWLCSVGYPCFPWVSDAANTDPQNVMHLIVTVLVLILLGAKISGQRSLAAWARICLAAMLIGPIGTSLLPAGVFGLFERIGTFSVVVFNAVLGMYLFLGKFDQESMAMRSSGSL